MSAQDKGELNDESGHQHLDERVDQITTANLEEGVESEGDEESEPEDLFEGTIVLGGVGLTSEDASSLIGTNWLCDVMIEFYLEYLKRVKFEQHSRQIEIIGPCVAQLIKMMDSADDILRYGHFIKLGK